MIYAVGCASKTNLLLTVPEKYSIHITIKTKKKKKREGGRERERKHAYQVPIDYSEKEDGVFDSP